MFNVMINIKIPYMTYFNIKSGILIFFIALLVRIGYVFFFIDAEYLFIEDQMEYIYLAREFSNSGFLGVATERVPGYPFFMSFIYTLFGKGVWNVILVQILLDSVSCVVIASMAQSLFGKGFFIAGILSAINLNMVILSASILTDSLFLFLFILFLFSLLKYLHNDSVMWFFLLTLFILLATLVRASSYYLLPILLVWLMILRLWKGDTILTIGKFIVLYLAIASIFLGGIHQRNYHEYGSTEFVSQTGVGILGWIVPGVYQYSGQGSYQEGQSMAKKKLDAALQRDNLKILPKNPFEDSSYRANVGKDILLEMGVVNIIKSWVVGATVNMLAPSVSFSPALRAIDHPSFYKTKGDSLTDKLFNYIKNSSVFLYILILAIGSISSVLFAVLALLGIFKIFSNVSYVKIITLLFLVFYFLAITGPIIGVKYRLPIEPILILFATCFLNKYFIKYGRNSKNTH